MTPAYCLEEFLACDTGREIQAEPIELPKLKKLNKNPRSSRQLQFTRQRSGKEKETQRVNPRDLQRALLEFEPIIDQDRHVRKLPKAVKKNHLNGLWYVA